MTVPTTRLGREQLKLKDLYAMSLFCLSDAFPSYWKSPLCYLPLGLCRLAVLPITCCSKPTVQQDLRQIKFTDGVTGFLGPRAFVVGILTNIVNA
jgi:hypothetical protein